MQTHPVNIYSVCERRFKRIPAVETETKVYRGCGAALERNVERDRVDLLVWSGPY